MNTHTPRLHLGCGESLRSHWLLGLATAERKPLSAARTSATAKAKRGRVRR